MSKLRNEWSEFTENQQENFDHVKFVFSCFNVLRFTPCVMVKNNKWKYY